MRLSQRRWPSARARPSLATSQRLGSRWLAQPAWLAGWLAGWLAQSWFRSAAILIPGCGANLRHVRGEIFAAEKKRSAPLIFFLSSRRGPARAAAGRLPRGCRVGTLSIGKFPARRNPALGGRRALGRGGGCRPKKRNSGGASWEAPPRRSGAGLSSDRPRRDRRWGGGFLPPFAARRALIGGRPARGRVRGTRPGPGRGQGFASRSHLNTKPR